MNALKKIRDAFGIGQAEMAILFDCGLSHYKMSETGKRELPEKSKPIFEWLATEAESTPPQTFPEVSLQKKEYFIMEWEAKKRKQVKALKSLETKWRQQKAMVDLPQKFKSQFPDQMEAASGKVLEGLGLKAGAELMDQDGKEIHALRLQLLATEAVLTHLKTIR